LDVGCFTADTKVRLTDGRDLSFLELIKEDKQGKENFCYSLDENNNIVISKILNPRKIKKVDKLIEIVLDNNEKIKCTEDHIFYTRDGKQVEARNLFAGQSLMPLYIKKSKNIDKKLINSRYTTKTDEYLIVYNPNTNLWDFVHYLSDNYNSKNNICKLEKSKCIRHHKDFNKYNNNPINIQRVGWKEHFEIHGHYIKGLDKNSERMKQNRENGIKQLTKYNKSEKGRKKSSETLKKTNKECPKEIMYRYNSTEVAKKQRTESNKKKKIYLF